MHAIIWEFTVREECIRQFTAAYGAGGDWANLFRRAKGFLGTELLRSCVEPNVFLTVDRWESASSFDMFQERFGTEYKNMDKQFACYTSSERRLGIFTGAED